MAHTDTLNGQTISRYRMLERLGTDGREEVYPAHDSTFDWTVAVPFLLAEAPRDNAAHKRLVTEAHAAAAPIHPVICKGCNCSAVWELR